MEENNLNNVVIEENAVSEQPETQAAKEEKKSVLGAKIAFYIIGGLTLANVLLFFLLPQSFFYPAGLMLQYYVDKLANAVYTAAGLNFIYLIAVIINVALGLGYIAIGVFSTPKRNVLVLAGLIVYVIDLGFCIVSVFSDWLCAFDIAIHLALLFLIFMSLKQFIPERPKKEVIAEGAAENEPAESEDADGAGTPGAGEQAADEEIEIKEGENPEEQGITGDEAEQDNSKTEQDEQQQEETQEKEEK